jgi:hypothetical protein
MRKTTWFAAVVAVLVLIGVGIWIGIRTLIPTSAVAGSTDNAPNAPMMITGAKGLPTSHYDDYDIVAH